MANITVGALKVTFKTPLPASIAATRIKVTTVFSYQQPEGGPEAQHTILKEGAFDVPVVSMSSDIYTLSLGTDLLLTYADILTYLSEHPTYTFLKIVSISLQIGLVNSSDVVTNWLSYGDITTYCKQLFLNETIRNWLEWAGDDHTSIKIDNTSGSAQTVITTATFASPERFDKDTILNDRSSYSNDVYIQLDDLCGLFYEDQTDILTDLENWAIIPTQDNASDALVNNWDTTYTDIVMDSEHGIDHYYLMLPEVTVGHTFQFDEVVEFAVVCHNRIVAKIGVGSDLAPA